MKQVVAACVLLPHRAFTFPSSFRALVEYGSADVVTGFYKIVRPLLFRFLFNFPTHVTIPSCSVVRQYQLELYLYT